MWPPNSPDLNRVNYRIWRVMQEQLCQTLMQVLVEPRQRVTSTWAGFQQIVVDETASVRAQGRHFLPRDAMRNRRLRSRPVSVRLYVCHVGAFYPHG